MDSRNVKMTYHRGIILSANEQLGSHSVIKYDELSATVSWSGPDPDIKFEAPLVRGMAYASVLYEKLAPKLIIGNLVSVNGETNGQVSGMYNQHDGK